MVEGEGGAQLELSSLSLEQAGNYTCAAVNTAGLGESEAFQLEIYGMSMESMLLFLFPRTEFRVFFSSAEVFGREFREFASIFVQRKGIPSYSSSAEGFGTEFRGFLFRGIAGIPSEITICSVYSVFRGIIFLSENPNPTPPPCIWARIQGRYWSAKIDDISL